MNSDQVDNVTGFTGSDKPAGNHRFFSVTSPAAGLESFRTVESHRALLLHHSVLRRPENWLWR